ncbi:Uncharacterised protein [uncultured archaeon]|nr:Uncharacterised protein [uncultured archaeon]
MAFIVNNRKDVFEQIEVYTSQLVLKALTNRSKDFAILTDVRFDLCEYLDRYEKMFDELEKQILQKSASGKPEERAEVQNLYQKLKNVVQGFKADVLSIINSLEEIGNQDVYNQYKAKISEQLNRLEVIYA